MQYIIEPEKRLPICEEVDLCVIGGSCTGLFAAVRAARLGLRVALIEKQNCLGGMATAGLVNIWHSLHDFYGEEQIIGGLTFETIQRLEKNGGCYARGGRACRLPAQHRGAQACTRQLRARVWNIGVFSHVLLRACCRE